MVDRLPERFDRLYGPLQAFTPFISQKQSADTISKHNTSSLFISSYLSRGQSLPSRLFHALSFIAGRPCLRTARADPDVLRARQA